jgi:hypothetical protein
MDTAQVWCGLIASLSFPFLFYFLFCSFSFKLIFDLYYVLGLCYI